MTRTSEALPRAELAVALLISGLVIVLNLQFSTQAGPLWRDEADTVQFATRPTYAEVLNSLHLESTPALYPTLVRVWSAWSPGEQDSAMRALGFSVATATVGAIWVTGWVLRAGPPLLALALFGAHVATLQTLGSVRPYGLGTLLIVLAFGAIGLLTSEPRRGPLLYALAVAILAVQTLYHNATLILAACVAGVAVAAVARDRLAARAVVATGVAAAVSLLLYVGAILGSRNWRSLNETDFDTRRLLVRSSGVLIEGNWRLAVLWAAAAVLAVYGAIRVLRRSSSSEPAAPGRRVLYAALVIVCATAIYLGFLKLAGRDPQAWQFVPLIGLVALALDVVLAGTLPLRWARLGVALLVTAVAFPVSMDRVSVRQTNVDLIAQYLHTAAQRGDLIVVNPWYVGISFNRYYRGPAEWMTLPPIEDHTIHRYDLLKLRMTSPEPLAPLYRAILSALESGHRVWLVGGLRFPREGQLPPVLPPAPAAPTGWSDGPYAITWALQVGHFVQTHAERLAVVGIPVGGPVNNFENMSLLVVEGWRRPGPAG